MSPAHDDRFLVIEAGITGDEPTARAALDHQEAPVRASAIRALARMGHLAANDIDAAIGDSSPLVRLAGVECAVGFEEVDVTFLLHDPDVFVAEMTAWCLGERAVSDSSVECLIDAARNHADPVVREASVAALGSLGDERALETILAACGDKPAVRRRAVLALAPFEDPRVDEALRIALEDRDWQVRQNAEILTSPRGASTQQ